MDRTDQRIISELQNNGRLSNQDLSVRINLSPSPCLRRLRILEETGVITGYTALVDQKAIGLSATAFISIRLERHSKESVSVFEDMVGDIPEILDCYLMSGLADYLLRVAIENLDAYELFIKEKIHEIPGIASIDTSFAFGTIKQTPGFVVSGGRVKTQS